MQLHNVYNDILFYLAKMVNNILGNIIQNFEFNIANSSFVLKYNANYKLPAMIVNYDNVEFYNVRLNTFHRMTENQFQLPVVHNYTKNFTLYHQEDLYTFNISMIINFDSQLEVLQNKHILDKFLPLNKPLIFYKFYSFYSIDDEYNNKFFFDFENDKISNVVLYHDKIKNVLDHCYVVEYQPLVKVTGSNFSFNELLDSTFSLNLNFEVLSHLPVAVFIKPTSPQQFHYLENKEFYKTFILRFENLTVPVNPEYEWLEITYSDRTRRNISAPKNNQIITRDLTTTKKVLYEFAVADVIYKNQNYNVVELHIFTGNQNIKYGSIEHPDIFGKISKITDSSCFLDGVINNYPVKDNITLTNFEVLFTRYQLENTIIHTNVADYRYLPVGNIKEKINTINFSRTEINPEYIMVSRLIYEDGTNESPILEKTVEDQFIIFHNSTRTIEFKIHRITSQITIVRSPKTINEIEFSLVGFNYIPTRNFGLFRKVNFNFTVDNHPISFFNVYQQNNQYRFNLIIDYLDFEIDDTGLRYNFIIELPYYNDLNITQYNFNFPDLNTSFDQTNPFIFYDKERSIPYKLYFSITKNLYENYFKFISKITPLFFSAR